MIDAWLDFYANCSDALLESVVQPTLFALHMGGWVEDAYAMCDGLVLGVVQLLFMVLFFTPLEHWWPVEKSQDRSQVRIDVIYTLIHRLGLFRLFFFLVFNGPIDYLWGHLRVLGVPTLQLDDWVPGANEHPVLGFLFYLVVFDFVGYWLHRAQHQWNWWWSLHAVHHSQRSMTYWSDSRNHLLDDAIMGLVGVILGQCFGVPPSQFVVLIALTQIAQSFQHANIKFTPGPWLERVWVSPRFHRYHHSIGGGHEFEHGVLGGHNFGVLLPWWDIIFRTAKFDDRFESTGIRDQVEQNVEYGRGFWSQQLLGLKRLGLALSTANRNESVEQAAQD